MGMLLSKRGCFISLHRVRLSLIYLEDKRVRVQFWVSDEPLEQILVSRVEGVSNGGHPVLRATIANVAFKIKVTAWTDGDGAAIVGETPLFSTTC